MVGKGSHWSKPCIFPKSCPRKVTKFSVQFYKIIWQFCTKGLTSCQVYFMTSVHPGNICPSVACAPLWQASRAPQSRSSPSQ